MKKELKFVFDLNCKFSVYVPSTVNVNEKTDNSQYVKKVLHDLSAWFGGATSTPAKGAWNCADGSTVLEDVTICYAYCTSEQAVEKFSLVLGLCEWIKKEMKQEAVSLEYNGQLKFI